MGFDEVSYAVYEEEPGPPRRPRRLRRMAVVGATTALVLGGLVSGASAVTDSHQSLTARQGRNPQTGETIQIAATKAPRFQAAAPLKQALKA